MDTLDVLRPVDRHTRAQLNIYLGKIEDIFEADALTIFSPILPNLENIVKRAVEFFQEREIQNNCHFRHTWWYRRSC